LFTAHSVLGWDKKWGRESIPDTKDRESTPDPFPFPWPRRISFRGGALLTGVVGVVVQPWRLVEDPSGYIFKWLVAYSALLGAVGGVLIADYFLVRRTRLDLRGLYQRGGPYWYTRGFHGAGLLALAVGVIPCVPGFLATVGLMEAAPLWTELYHYAWFLSFGLSFLVYAGLMLSRRGEGQSRYSR
jgi:NCS1 family nucleobase:cation symporter-1